LEDNDFKFIRNENNYNEFMLIFYMNAGRTKFDFNVSFETKTRKNNENMDSSSITKFVMSIDDKYNSFTNKIEVRLRDLDLGIDKKFNNFLNEIKDENKKIIKELEGQYENKFLSLSKRLEELEKLQYNEIKKKHNHLDIIKHSTQLYPRLFEDIDSSEILESNDNRTFVKKGGGWKGVRGDVIPNVPGTYKFSVKIDKCNINCLVMVGFCLSTHDGSKGYHDDSNCVVLLLFNDGLIYCPNLDDGTAKTGFKGTQGMIITSVIDTNNKHVEFYVNGNRLINQTVFNLSDNDLSKICPCMNLCGNGDVVSVIDY
jgi:hypothetical protein